VTRVAPGGAAPPRTTARDLRVTGLGAAAWAGALTGHGLVRQELDVRLLGLVAAAVVLLLVVRVPRSWVLVALVLAVVAWLRVDLSTDNVVGDLGERRAFVTAEGRVSSDPVVRTGRFSDVVVYRLLVTAVDVPVRARTRAPVVVLADPSTARPAWGSTVRFEGRLVPADDADTAALVSLRRSPVTVAEASTPHRAAEAVRRSIRTASGGPSPGDLLVPALVDGDDVALPEAVVTDFRTAGLTHLTAVSGANLTILLAFLLPLARWTGVRAHGLLLVGVLGIVGFVLVARPEPSVLRAAAMGTAALIGLGWGGRAAGARALGAAVLVLLLADPGLAVTWGFALSIGATAGILFLAPVFRDALLRHLPRWLAEAIAVPLAAQLACTPLVAVLSAEVSVVAVVANLVAAPLVGPTTILGLAAGLLGLLAAPLGVVPGWCAGVFAHGIVLVGRHAAAVPGAAVPWSASGWPLAGLVVLCVLVAWWAPRLLRSRRLVLLSGLALTLALLRPPAPGWWDVVRTGDGWPPPGWALVMCDVGQGDALALNAGDGSAVVVDAGPEPQQVDRCLRRLGVSEVPVVVLTHFHDDHVAGLPGVLAGRAVGEVLVSPLPSPAYGAGLVERAVREAGVRVRVPASGETVTVGGVRWQLLGPERAVGDSPNDSSLVMLAVVQGITVMLAGDVEPPAQALLARAWGLTEVDVLKVPHHGSRYQDDGFLRTLRPSVALVPIGEDNDYGHPAQSTLDLLRAGGASVWRTDTSGDLAVVADGESLRVVARG
jgi:competence protein ComEC